jgi:hypothetical protein
VFIYTLFYLKINKLKGDGCSMSSEDFCYEEGKYVLELDEINRTNLGGINIE